MISFDGAGDSRSASRPPAPEVNMRVALAGVVLMLGLALCVLMAAVTAKHYGRAGVMAEPMALAGRPP